MRVLRKTVRISSIGQAFIELREEEGEGAKEERDKEEVSLLLFGIKRVKQNKAGCFFKIYLI